MTRRQALEEDATNLLLTTIPTDWGGHVCDRRGEVGREEPKDGRFVAQETQTTLKSARDVIKKEATVAVSCREGSHKLGFHGGRSSPASSRRGRWWSEGVGVIFPDRG